ncbi:MAG: DUF1801 domain-containing protein [Cytophagales bacterium]|nr:DUF1801 domain-containing protein [Cytophagales bacterium]
MTKLKTQKNNASVEDFLNGVENEKRKTDSFEVLKLMKKVTDAEPCMWGPSIIGFGHYHYKYATGRENDWFLTGLSPRKQSLTLYIMNGFTHYNDILSRLGKYKTGKSCLYINRLEDIDMQVLEELITASVNFLKSKP